MEGDAGLLPAEVLMKIFSYCSFRDLVNVQFVCRWWQQVSRDARLWRDIVYRPHCNNVQEVIDNLKGAPQLRALDLTYVRHSFVVEELFKELEKRCPRLVQLTLSSDWLRRDAKFVMKQIKILTVEVCQVSAFAPFDHVFEFSLLYLHKYFPNVEHLDCISYYVVEGDLKAYLKKKGSSLHTVGFSCRADNGKCVLPCLSVCPSLKCLTLYELCGQAGRLPVRSAEHLKQISSVTIRDTELLYVTDYSSFFRFFPNLVMLELDGCSLHDKHMFVMVAEKCPLLEKLTLSSLGCYFGDDNLKFVSDFKKLTFLRLSYDYYITDACVAHLQAISELRHLDIVDCEGMTPQCLLALCGFDKLQTLKFDLQGCDPPADLSDAHVKNPDLHIMFYNCSNNSVLDHLRYQRLRISLLKR